MMDWTSFFIGIGVSGFLVVCALLVWAGKNVTGEQRRTIDGARRMAESHEKLLEYWRKANECHRLQAQSMERIADILDERLFDGSTDGGSMLARSKTA